MATLPTIERFMPTEDFIVAVRNALAILNSGKADDNAVLHSILLGAANGVASLDADGKVPASQLGELGLEIHVILAVTDTAPDTANVGDKYFNNSTNMLYTWDGSAWVDPVPPTINNIYISAASNVWYWWTGTAMTSQPQVDTGAQAVSIDSADQGWTEDGSDYTLKLNISPTGTPKALIEIVDENGDQLLGGAKITIEGGITYLTITADAPFSAKAHIISVA